ncbi:cyclin-domain-containing protein [Aspergillus crustosus]
MEIRTRKVVRRYVSTDSGRTCKRPNIFNRDEYYYRRYAQHRQPEKIRPITKRIIETRVPLRDRTSLDTLWKRDESPVRSQPFKMRLPFGRKVPSKADDYEPKPRGRPRSPRLFVVDPEPEPRYRWPRAESPRSLSPEIRCISPRRSLSPRRPSPPRFRRVRKTVTDDTVRQSRSLERPRGPRPPRERTPINEREPVRRRPQSVEIHQSLERRDRSGSSGRRQVRFADDVEYEEHRRRPRGGRYESRQAESDDSIRDGLRRRIHRRSAHEDIDYRPRYRHLSPERTASRRFSTPRLRREDDTVVAERPRLQPRIIQDGYREISEAGDRIYAEGRRRRGQERDYHDFVSHSSSRLRRRYNDDRGFSSEDESYLPGLFGLQPLPKDAENDSNIDYSTDVFDISPDTALGLLCCAMDKLEIMSNVATLRTQGSETPTLDSKSDSTSGEETPTRITELHFAPTGEDPLGRDLMQQSVLSKRFLSKREPPITLKEYLIRLHRYCPLSTGVYLATSLYITRMVSVDRIILVNRKNVHRLVLAGLRVAMKTLEDLSYSHSRVAKVGGVTEKELSRLEISFCFLADFELRVDKQMLVDQARLLQWNMMH